MDWLIVARERVRATAVWHLECAALNFLEHGQYSDGVDAAIRLATEAPEHEDEILGICSALMSAQRYGEVTELARATIAAQRSALGADSSEALTVVLHEATGILRHKLTLRATSFRPRLAVLPFQASSADPAEQALAKGFMTEVMYDLSSNPEIEVLSRALTDSVREASNLGGYLSRTYAIDLIVEGCIQPSAHGRYFFLSATDLSSGNVVWSSRAEVQENALEHLSDIAQRLAMALCTTLSTTLDQLRPPAKRFSTLSVHAAVRKLYDAFAVEEHERCYLQLRGVLEHDQGHAPSWLLLAYLCEGLEVRGIKPPGTDPTVDRRRAIKHAFALDPYDGRIRIEVGDMLFAEGKTDKADFHYRKGVAMTRGANELLSIKAKYMAGALADPDGARATLNQARTLFPKNDVWLNSNVTRTLTILGDYQDALDAARLSPPSTLHLACHAVSAMQTGNVDEARNVRRQLEEASGGKTALEIFQSKHFRPYARTGRAIGILFSQAKELENL
jgi:TolB-like protein